MFNLIKNIADGRVMNSHTIYDKSINLANKVLTVIIRSWPSDSDYENKIPNYLEFKVDITFTDWDPDCLLTMEQDVQTHEWQYYNNEFVTPPPFDLTTAQETKSTELNNACQANIYLGYDSEALGSVHHYPSNDKDQANMVASVTNALYPDLPLDWKTAFWCADTDGVWEFRDHTAAQIRRAGADGKDSISASLLKNAQLQAQVLSATTEEQLNAITW